MRQMTGELASFAVEPSRFSQFGLLAIRRLRANEKLPLTAIRTRLQAFTDQQLEAFATEGPLPGEVATALGLPPRGAPSASSGLPDHPAILAPAGLRRAQAPTWVRLELALGLELHLRDDASPSVHDMARRIHEMSGLNVKWSIT